MEIISRKNAIARGLSKYFTGIPCRRGHLNERYTITSSCVVCLKGYREGVQKRLNDNNMALQLNYVRPDINVHPQDVGLMRDFASLVNNARVSGSYALITAIEDYIRALKQAEQIG